jgi:hypothetical protein
VRCRKRVPDKSKNYFSERTQKGTLGQEKHFPLRDSVTSLPQIPFTSFERDSTRVVESACEKRDPREVVAHREVP